MEQGTFKGPSQACNFVIFHTLHLFKDLPAQEVPVGIGKSGSGVSKCNTALLSVLKQN